MRSLYILITFLLIFISVSDAPAQAPGWMWARSVGSVGNDVCESIAVDDSGNVFITGSYEGTADFDPGPGVFNLTSQGILDVFVLKLDPNGNFVWAISIGGTGTDKDYSIKADHIGSVFITGRFANTVDFDPGAGVFNMISNGDKDVYIVKISPLGNFIWAKSVGGTGDDEGFGIAVDLANDVLVTGYFQNTVDFDPDAGVFNLSSNGNYDAFVLKLEGSGNFLWAVSYGALLNDDGFAITTDSANNVYATGYFINTVDFDPGPGTDTLATNGYMDAYVLKLDESGNYLWARNLGGIQTDNGTSIYVDAAQNVYSTGTFLGTADFDPGTGSQTLTAVGNSDVYISKLDNKGMYRWADGIGGGQADYSYSIATDIYGEIYVSGLFRQLVDFDPGPGVFNLIASDNDGYILKLDTSGNFIWAQKIGGLGQYSENIQGIAFDKGNHLIVTGHFMSYQVTIGNDTLTNTTAPGTADIYIAKLDSVFITSTGVQNNKITNALHLYPNPVKDQLIISIPTDMNGEMMITVSDISGRQYIKTAIMVQNKMKINTSGLPGGVYLVKIQCDRFTEIQKFVVIR